MRACVHCMSALPCVSNYIPEITSVVLFKALLHICIVSIAYVYTRSQPHIDIFYSEVKIKVKVDRLNISYHSSLSVRIQKEVTRKP